MTGSRVWRWQRQTNLVTTWDAVQCICQKTARWSHCVTAVGPIRPISPTNVGQNAPDAVQVVIHTDTVGDIDRRKVGCCLLSQCRQSKDRMTPLARLAPSWNVSGPRWPSISRRLLIAAQTSIHHLDRVQFLRCLDRAQPSRNYPDKVQFLQRLDRGRPMRVNRSKIIPSENIRDSN